MKTIRECLNQIDYMLYTKHISIRTPERKDTMHNVISHLSIKDYDKLQRGLNSILLLAEQKGNLLTHQGLLNILIKEYPTELQAYVKSEIVRKFMEDDEPKPRILNEEIKCSTCGSTFFSKKDKYHYICSYCSEKYNLD